MIWYNLYNLKNVKNTLGGSTLLVKLQAEACNCTKSIIPPWMLFPFFKLRKIVPNRAKHHILFTHFRFIYILPENVKNKNFLMFSRSTEREHWLNKVISFLEFLILQNVMISNMNLIKLLLFLNWNKSLQFR